MRRRTVRCVVVSVLLCIVSGVLLLLADWPVKLCFALLLGCSYAQLQHSWYALTDPLMVFPVEPLALHAEPDRVVHGVLHVGSVALPAVLVVYDNRFAVVTLPHIMRIQDADVITGEQAYKVTVNDIRRVVVCAGSLEFELTRGLLGCSWVHVPITPLTRELCEACQDMRVPKDRSIARRVYRWWSRVMQSRDKIVA